MRLRKLSGPDVLYIQMALQQEKSLRTLKEIMRNLPLKIIEEYWEEMRNGDIKKRGYYKSARQAVGKKPNLEVLKRNFLNYENKAYMEFLEKYR